jgi:hypothetical protein
MDGIGFTAEYTEYTEWECLTQRRRDAKKKGRREEGKRGRGKREEFLPQSHRGTENEEDEKRENKELGGTGQRKWSTG